MDLRWLLFASLASASPKPSEAKRSQRSDAGHTPASYKMGSSFSDQRRRDRGRFEWQQHRFASAMPCHALPKAWHGKAWPMRAKRRNRMSHRMKIWLPHDFDMTLPLGPTSDQLKEELQTRLLSRYEARRRLHPWAPISRKTIPSNRIECNAAAPLARPRAMPVPSILPMGRLPCVAKAWQTWQEPPFSMG